MTRIVFVGQTGRGQTSAMRCAALGRLGHDVRAFDSTGLWRGASYLTRQLGELTGRSARIDRFNEELLTFVAREQPALLWAEKQEYIDPSLLRELRRRGVTTLHYNPDPYFTLRWKRTARADECVRQYDVLVVTKRYEMEEYRRQARGQVIYSPLGYDPKVHTPPTVRSTDPGSNIVFVGGWEPRREQMLVEATRITRDVSIWGYGWCEAQGRKIHPLRAIRLGRLTPGRSLYWGEPSRELFGAIRSGEAGSGEIYEEQYARVVSGAKVALGFLREVCPDQHTTRSFEIPAMGGFMLADRTEEHLSFFEEGLEAEFFSSDEEYLDKLRFYLTHDEQRKRIAAAGRQRCLSSGYSYDERLRTIMDELAPRAHTATSEAGEVRV